MDNSFFRPGPLVRLWAVFWISLPSFVHPTIPTHMYGLQVENRSSWVGAGMATAPPSSFLSLCDKKLMDPDKRGVEETYRHLPDLSSSLIVELPLSAVQICKLVEKLKLKDSGE